VGGPKTVPIGRWVKLTYLHDGFASIRLFIDDVLVAQNTALASSIRPVGPRGIHVGNWPDADAYTFYGAIDDVRIWKWEPDYGYLQFFCRDRAQCATWRDVYASLGAWSRGPEGRRRVQALYRCLGNLQLDLVRTVRRQDAATLAAIRTLSERYHRAWCAGDIDGRDMRQVLEDWFRALREILGDGVLDGYVRRMVACFEQHGLRDGLVPKVDFTCDTAFPGFIEAVARTFRLEQADGSQSR
jgi:hypothetical protein